MNNINKLFFITCAISFTNLFSMKYGYLESRANLLKQEDDWEIVAKDNEAAKNIDQNTVENIEHSLKHKKIKQDENNIFIKLRINVEDPKKNITVSQNDNLLNIEILSNTITLKIIIDNTKLKFKVTDKIIDMLTDKRSGERSLPSAVNLGKSVKPSYKHGILKFVIEKKESKKIEVETE
ncbi:hypothetical protein M1446_00545 [Candidatus Dependentiae bacterium]|nr:hypothetical protein [Candidatus Dependentiae bacterium]